MESSLMDDSIANEIRLFNADSLEYCGSILVKSDRWEYSKVEDSHLIKMTAGLPLKGVLANLIYFNYVYEIVGLQLE
jgi:hypothetical protein